jgi:hypothetical protein
MKLEVHGGPLFSLVVNRYEFPDEDLRPTEDNPVDEFETGRFLVVTASFRNADGQWNASGPIMTTDELERLAEWLDSVVKGHPLSAGIYFTERDLEFSIDLEERNLLVHVSRDFRPNWSMSSETVTITFPVDHIDLRCAVESLRSQLNRFPGRPPIQAAS